MKLLKLELIGNGSSKGGVSPCCRKVIALGHDSFIVTEPMKPNRDYSKANGVGSRGVYDYYVLKPGNIYEIIEVLSWKRSRRYYAFILPDSSVKEMDYGEAIECLSGGSISMY
jgi:hypothetical protein